MQLCSIRTLTRQVNEIERELHTLIKVASSGRVNRHRLHRGADRQLNRHTAHGRDHRRRFWREWLAAWQTVQADYELVDAGDRVVALLDQRMRGRSTEIEVPFGEYAQVFTFKDGRIVHWKAYLRQADALKAVGLAR